MYRHVPRPRFMSTAVTFHAFIHSSNRYLETDCASRTSNMLEFRCHAQPEETYWS